MRENLNEFCQENVRALGCIDLTLLMRAAPACEGERWHAVTLVRGRVYRATGTTAWDAASAVFEAIRVRRHRTQMRRVTLRRRSR